jgi:hypothetical protein
MIGRTARWTPGLDRRAVFHPPPAPLTVVDAARVPASARHVVVVGGGIAGLTAALALAEPVYAEYRKVALVEPLQKQLKLKKAKMEETLKAYAVASDYGVADVSTAATYRVASIYQDFGRALLGSERPRKLSKAELEQYNVLLEEQAYPFEEKATELHEVNARRAADGIYDVSVRASFKALAELRPLRYGKLERGEEVIDVLR